jgi:predicted transcriptional regulator
MSVPCEVAVKCVLPVIRAMIAKELTTKHQLKQREAADLLGVSQPAISLYYRKIRGKAIDLEKDTDVRDSVENAAKSLVREELSRTDLIVTYCGICRTIRAKGLLCQLHKAFDPAIDIEKCELCFVTDSKSCV